MGENDTDYCKATKHRLLPLLPSKQNTIANDRHGSSYGCRSRARFVSFRPKVLD